MQLNIFKKLYKITIMLQLNYNKGNMKNKKRFVLLIEEDIFEDFKSLAKEQNRTAGNLGATLIKEYVKNNKSK